MFADLIIDCVTSAESHINVQQRNSGIYNKRNVRSLLLLTWIAIDISHDPFYRSVQVSCQGSCPKTRKIIPPVCCNTYVDKRHELTPVLALVIIHSCRTAMPISRCFVDAVCLPRILYETNSFIWFRTLFSRSPKGHVKTNSSDEERRGRKWMKPNVPDDSRVDVHHCECSILRGMSSILW